MSSAEPLDRSLRQAAAEEQGEGQLATIQKHQAYAVRLPGVTVVVPVTGLAAKMAMGARVERDIARHIPAHMVIFILFMPAAVVDLGGKLEALRGLMCLVVGIVVVSPTAGV